MNRPARLVRRAAAVVSLLAASASAGQAQIIDFEAANGSSCYTQTCSFQGFDFFFESAGWGISHDGNSYFNRSGLGSAGLAAAHGQRYGYTRITMTKTGGGAFDFSSFLAAVDNPAAGSPGNLDLLADFFGGGTIATNVSIGSSFASYNVSGFSNITTLRFTNTNQDAGFGIDNLNLSSTQSTVPEPSSVALVAAGLLAMGMAARRRRTA